MLLAAGRGIANLLDYTTLYDRTTFEAAAAQGDTLASLNVTLHDAALAASIAAEDDILALDERDPNGWPTVNLLANPSFEGTYSGGVAPNWTASTNGAGTLTPSANTSSPLYGSACQQVAISNLTSGAYYNLLASVTLPTNENGAPLRAQPYVFSIYYQITTAVTNANLNLYVDWHDASGAYMSTAGVSVGSNPGTTGWRRAYTRVTAPAGAMSARVYLQYVATSATNSGAWLMDGAQFEYATHGDVPVPLNLALPLLNGTFDGILGPGEAKNWQTSGSTTGVSYNVVSTPSLGASAQQIQCASLAASTTVRAVAQVIALPCPLWNYQVTLAYQITGALSANAIARVGVSYLDINQNATIASFTADSAPGLGVSQGWQTLTLAIGPGYTGTNLSGSYWLTLSAGLRDSVDASWGGTIVLGSITLAPLFGNPDSATALAAQKYPTLYCDASQVGCSTDRRSGLTYRQMRVFGGFVKSADNDYSHGPERDIKIRAVEYGVLLQEAEVTLTIANQLDQAAIQAAGDYAVTLGYLAGLDYTTYVQAITTVNAQSFAMGSFKDVLNACANQSTAAYWVDWYLFLHYTPALSQSAPYALSDAPDLSTTFPYVGLHVISDSTQTATDAVLEGSPQTSAPQTYSASGVNTTLAVALTSGNAYTSLGVAALTVAIPKGSQLTINTGGGTTQVVTTSSAVAVGATSIPVTSFTANANYATNTPVAVGTTFVVYNGDAITQVDSIVAAGVTLTAGQIGLASNDTLGQNGIIALYAPDTGTVTLLTALSAAQSCATVFRFSAPVLLRLISSAASASGGAVGRRIFSHTRIDTITSKQSAIDRGNADLATTGQPQPVVTCTVYSPQAPTATPLLVGQAIPFTHAPSGWSGVLLQIQQVKTHVLGNGAFSYDLQLGFYRPDAIILLAKSRIEAATAGSNLAGNTVLQEVLSVADGWVITDSVSGTVSNIGTWDGVSSTWDGSLVWA